MKYIAYGIKESKFSKGSHNMMEAWRFIDLTLMNLSKRMSYGQESCHNFFTMDHLVNINTTINFNEPKPHNHYNAFSQLSGVV
jgi:hypothetical protein